MTRIPQYGISKTIHIERPGIRSTETNALRVAVGAMISPRETVHLYHALLDYIAKKLGRNVELVQRNTYNEIDELFASGKIDLAFICSGPYAAGKDRYGFQALAVPQVRGKQVYQSYLIVRKDSVYQQLNDLKGKVFAFTDPDSNTGRLVPTFWLKQKGETPESFFSKIIYTHSHDNSIMAVAMSLVDGASVHEQIWKYFNDRNPVYTAKTRIIKESISFGNPPLVAAGHLLNPLRAQIGNLLFSMHQDNEGKIILDNLMIEKFIAPDDRLYLPILAMKQKCQ